MPLIPSVLEQSLSTMLQSPFETAAEAAQGWTDALEPYVLGLVPPSTTQSVAKAAFLASFSTAPSPAGLITSLQAYAASLALGMVPPGSPPPAPLSLVAFLGVPVRTHEQAAAELAILIDAWFRTGLTGTIPTPLPWS